MSLPRYPNYKTSGVEWLGEVPEHWTVKAMRTIAIVVRGASPRPAGDPKYFGGDSVPWVTVAEITKDNLVGLTETETFLTEEGATHSKLFKKGTVIYSNSGATLGVPKILRIDACANDGVVAFEKLTREVHPQFLYHYLASITDAIREKVKQGSGQPNLNTDIVKDLRFGLPPMDEQLAIEAFLDHETAKIDALAEEQHRLIDLLKEKRQAVISHAVTKGLNPHAPMKPSGIEWLGDVPEHWKVGKCGFYLTILSGFAFPSIGFTDDESDTKLLRGINVGVSRLKWDETVYWRRMPEDGLDIYEMHAGDLVIGMDRPLIGEGVRVAKVKKDDLPCLLLQRVASLKTGDLLNADYLLGLLSSEMFVAHFSPDTTGVSVPHISPEQIYNFVIPIPPVSEQEIVCAFIGTETAKFDALTSEAQRAIDLLQERRTALISAAVTGQIDVRGLVQTEAA